MSNTVPNLSAPSQLDEVRAAGPRRDAFRVNTHIHLPPNFSAFESVRDAVDAAAAEGLRVLGASNYYDHTVYGAFQDAARAADILPLFGLEIVARDEALAAQGTKVNDPGNQGKVYFCGKATVWLEPTRQGPEAIRKRIRQGDAKRIAAMVDRLAAVFREAGMDTGLDAERIRQQVVERYHVPLKTVFLQERHVCRAFQEWVWTHIPEDGRADQLERVLGTPVAAPDSPVAVQDAIRSHLLKAGKPAFVEERFVTVEEAKRLVLGMGGIPCYPVFADGGGEITPFEAPVEGLIERLNAWGIHATEFIPTRNSPDTLRRYVPALRKAGFIVTAGTEHNTLERIPLTPAAAKGAPIPEEVQAIFEEGACVLIAHQACAARLEGGYVDHTGALYEEAGVAIPKLAEMGRSLLEEFPQRWSR